MNGLALQVYVNDQWEWVALGDDPSISIEMQSPIFGNGSTFSYPFTIPVEPNRHILGNIDQIHGARPHKILDHVPARLYILGIPFRKGIIRLDEEVTIKPNGELEIDDLASGEKGLSVSWGDCTNLNNVAGWNVVSGGKRYMRRIIVTQNGLRVLPKGISITLQ